MTGDFNHNGVVDAADYVSWRNGTQNDYNTWRAHFGQALGSGAVSSLNSAVPEPGIMELLLIGILTTCSRRHMAVP